MDEPFTVPLHALVRSGLSDGWWVDLATLWVTNSVELGDCILAKSLQRCSHLLPPSSLVVSSFTLKRRMQIERDLRRFAEFCR